MHHTGWQYAAALSGTHYWYHRRRPAWSGSVLAIAYTAVASCVVGAPANPMQMRTIARLQHDSSTAGRSIMAVVQSTPRTQPSPQIHNELVSTGYLQTTHRCTAAPMRGTQPTHMCSPSAGPVARKLVVSMHGKQTQTCPRRVTATCTKLNAPQASVSSTPLIQPSPLPGEATPPQPRGQDHVDESWQTLMRWSRWLRRRSEQHSILQRVSKVVVFGGGSFGTAVAAALARQKTDLVVSLWLRDNDVCTMINEQHRNPRYLPVRMHMCATCCQPMPRTPCCLPMWLLPPTSRQPSRARSMQCTPCPCNTAERFCRASRCGASRDTHACLLLFLYHHTHSTEICAPPILYTHPCCRTCSPPLCPSSP